MTKEEFKTQKISATDLVVVSGVSCRIGSIDFSSCSAIVYTPENSYCNISCELIEKIITQ
jgi:hypothetical protein